MALHPGQQMSNDQGAFRPGECDVTKSVPVQYLSFTALNTSPAHRQACGPIHWYCRATVVVQTLNLGCVKRLLDLAHTEGYRSHGWHWGRDHVHNHEWVRLTASRLPEIATLRTGQYTVISQKTWKLKRMSQTPRKSHTHISARTLPPRPINPHTANPH